MLSGTHRPLNFENTFLPPPLNLLNATPQAHTCHVDIFFCWRGIATLRKKYAPNHPNPICIVVIGAGAASTQSCSLSGRTTRGASAAGGWGGAMACRKKARPHNMTLKWCPEWRGWLGHGSACYGWELSMTGMAPPYPDFATASNIFYFHVHETSKSY
jgi:hypothetical protein